MDHGHIKSMKKRTAPSMEIQKKDTGRTNSRNNKGMAAAATVVAAATPVKRDNSHVSPPDKKCANKGDSFISKV